MIEYTTDNSSLMRCGKCGGSSFRVYVNQTEKGFQLHALQCISYDCAETVYVSDKQETPENGL